MEIAGHPIGVCSWSLRPRDMADLAGQLRQLGLGHVQLALGPLLGLAADQRRAELAVLSSAGIAITAGMIAFPGEDYSSLAAIQETGGFCADRHWDERRAIALEAARLAAGVGIGLITTHVGFIPPSSHPQYATMVGRVREIAAAYGELGMELGMETGQEQAAGLLQFLNDLATRNVYVNFDPANMILYGAGDPIEALGTLGRHIRHVHLKDAIRSKQPGVQWGEEVVVGTGQVDLVGFLAALHSVGYGGPLVIERESGGDRVGDVRAAIVALQSA